MKEVIMKTIDAVGLGNILSVIALAILAAPFFQGCSTPMMKATPFYTGEVVYGISKSGKTVRWDDPDVAKIQKTTRTDDKGALDKDRINIWPLFYQNLLISSIIWPIGEINDVGWAVRPLVSVDNYNESYKALAYMWGYNAKKGTSYFIPLYLWSDKAKLTLLGGWGEEFTYIVPPMIIKNKDSKGDDQLLIMPPFSRFNLSKNESYILPIYIKDQDSFYSMLCGWGKEFAYVLPPLFIKVKEDDGSDALMFMAPFSRFNAAKSESYVLPAYIKDKDSFYTLLCGWGKDFLYILPPMFFKSKENDGSDVLTFMFPFSRFNTARGESYVFPAYAKGKNFFYTMLLGWDESMKYALPPFFIDGKEGNTEYRRILPFYYYYSDPNYSHSNYGFFGRMNKKISEKDHSSWYLLPFYYSRWDRHYSYEIDQAAEQQTESADKAGQRPQHKYKQVVTATKNSLIMPNILLSENEERGESELALLPFYWHDQKKNQITESSFLWLYTSKEDIDKKSAYTQAMWFLFYHERQEKTDKENNKSTARVLWKLFHKETIGEETNVDIFPFISYSGNPDRRRFSFCWRLFSYEKGNNSAKLHLLFVPVYWTESSGPEAVR